MSETPRFDPAALTGAANDNLSVRRVFGEAYEREGVLVIPVARVAGATGLGSGGGESDLPSAPSLRRRAPGDPEPHTGHGLGHGGGGGYAAHVKAVGVFVVDGSGVQWRPTLDLNRVILGGQVVLASALTAWAFAWAVRRRR